VVRPSSALQTGAGSITPVSGCHNSGTLPLTRNVQPAESNCRRWLERNKCPHHQRRDGRRPDAWHPKHRGLQIRLQVLLRENVGQGFVPDDASLAKEFSRTWLPSHLPQSPAAEFVHLRVAFRITGEARGMLRARADDGRAGAHQFGDATARSAASCSHHPGGRSARHSARRWPASDGRSSPPRAAQQHVGVDGVVIVTGGQRWIAGAHFHRSGFAGEIRGVLDGRPCCRRNSQRVM